MESFKKNKDTILIIAVLILLKFVAVPVIEWQEQKQVELHLLAKKLAKYEQIASNKNNITKDADLLSNKIYQIEKQFVDTQEVGVFELQMQQHVEAQLKEYNLRSTNIGWKPTVLVADDYLQRHILDFSFEGKTENIVTYLLALENQSHIQVITGLNLIMTRQSAGYLSRATARVRVTFFMRMTSEALSKVGDKSMGKAN